MKDAFISLCVFRWRAASSSRTPARKNGKKPREQVNQIALCAWQTTPGVATIFSRERRMNAKSNKPAGPANLSPSRFLRLSLSFYLSLLLSFYPPYPLRRVGRVSPRQVGGSIHPPGVYTHRVTPRYFIAAFAQFAETPGHRNEESANSCLEKEGLPGYSERKRARLHPATGEERVQFARVARRPEPLFVAKRENDIPRFCARD
ncbi:hypothetical protein PUN28_009307 [Cardiocondyla obscurior]|uniref:Uncharacterized protein n=1 Tax=Cardiocondyla obscurior TaxID=286306 RepID=A0AAW2FTT1_9HYME